jgi:hypothetical protein
VGEHAGGDDRQFLRNGYAEPGDEQDEEQTDVRELFDEIGDQGFPR